MHASFGLPRSADHRAPSLPFRPTHRNRVRSVARQLLTCLPVLGALCLGGVKAGAQAAYLGKPLGSGFSNPYGVAVDANGNVFVADKNHSAVKEILAAGGYTTVNTLGSGFSDPYDVAVDATGNVFVADTGNNAVKEILASGGYATVNTLGSGFSAPEGVALDQNGNVYVADSGNSAVKEMTVSSGYTSVVSLGGTFSFASPTGVAVDTSGNVYVADSGNAAVYEILAGSSFVNTLGSSWSWTSPQGLAVDASDNVFVADSGSGELLEIAPTGAVNPVDSQAFTAPHGVAVDASGDLYVADGNAVRDLQSTTVNFGSLAVNAATPATQTLTFTFTSSGTTVTPAVVTQGVSGLDYTDAGTGTCTTAGSSYSWNVGDTCTVDVKFDPKHPGPRDGGVVLSGTSLGVNYTTTVYLQAAATGPQVIFSSNSVQSSLGSGLSTPQGITVDAGGNIFVADQGNAAVKEILAAGGYATTNTLDSAFSFGSPAAVAVDGAGDIFVADQSKGAIYEIPAAGGYNSVVIVDIGFTAPVAVAVDASGDLFVADQGAGSVYEILASSDYNTINTLDSGFVSLSGIAVDSSGNIYVADAGAPAVYEMLAAGGYSTVNTLASTFSFGSPGPLAVDANDNLYVADHGNAAVYEILAAGGYTTVNTVGSGFTSPVGVSVDASGNLYVTDGNTVQKLDFSDPPTLTFAATDAGATTDPTQTVTVANDGNQNLSFTRIAYGTDFPKASGVGTDCSTAHPVQPGNTCTLSIDFSPLLSSATGSSTPLSESVALTDNGSTPNQSVSVNGTEIDNLTPPSMQTPTPSTTLDNTSTVTFTWNPGSGNVAFLLDVGTRGPGSSDVYSGKSTTSASVDVPNIPTSGANLYVRLYYREVGTWHSIDYAYTEYGTLAAPWMITPVPSSTLGNSSTVTFTWNQGSGNTLFRLVIGTTGSGSDDLDVVTTGNNSATVTNIPTTGAQLYVRLVLLRQPLMATRRLRVYAIRNADAAVDDHPGAEQHTEQQLERHVHLESRLRLGGFQAGCRHHWTGLLRCRCRHDDRRRGHHFRHSRHRGQLVCPAQLRDEWRLEPHRL